MDFSKRLKIGEVAVESCRNTKYTYKESTAKLRGLTNRVLPLPEDTNRVVGPAALQNTANWKTVHEKDFGPRVGTLGEGLTQEKAALVSGDALDNWMTRHQDSKAVPLAGLTTETTTRNFYASLHNDQIRDLDPKVSADFHHEPSQWTTSQSEAFGQRIPLKPRSKTSIEDNGKFDKVTNMYQNSFDNALQFRKVEEIQVRDQKLYPKPPSDHTKQLESLSLRYEPREPGTYAAVAARVDAARR